MPRQPLFMALSNVSVRLQRAGDNLPVDPVFGSRASTPEEQFEDPIIMRGQPRFRLNKALQPRIDGDAELTDGYVTFAVKELDRVGVEPDRLKHALLVSFERDGASRTEAFQVVRVDHRGHLTGGPILVKAHVRAHKDTRGSL